MSAQQLTPGTYFGRVIDAFWTESTKTSSVGVHLKFLASHVKNEDGEWAPLQDPGESEGTLWVIGKNQQLNETPHKTLVNVFGWDGNPDNINREWFAEGERGVCQFIVVPDDYNKNRITYKVDSVWPRDSNGPGVQRATAAGMSKIKSQYGAMFRAASGASKPGGAPRPVPPAAPSTAPKTPLPTPRNLPPAQGAVIAAPSAQREPGGDDAEGA